MINNLFEPKIYTLLGRAGCGKGTQARFLVEKFGLFYIGSGELLRDRGRIEDFTGQKTLATMSRGRLVPSSLIFMLWANKLEEIKQENSPDFKGIIFDGSPRKIGEAYLLEEALEWYEWNKNFKAVYIDISRRMAFDRLTKRRQCRQCNKVIPYIGEYKDLTVCDKCGGELVARPDDAPEAINRRLDLFNQEVMPVINYFEKKGVLVRVNGEQAIEEVQREILSKIL